MQIETELDKNRYIVLSNDINDYVIKEVIEKILEISDYDARMSEIYNNYKIRPIELIINSFGGSVYDGLALYGIIEKSYTPVYTYGFGKIMSMGAIIFLAGVQRYSHKYATFMLHEAASGLFGSITELKENIKELDRVQKILSEIISEKTKITKEKIKLINKEKLDWYISANEAVKLGIANKLI